MNGSSMTATAPASLPAARAPGRARWIGTAAGVVLGAVLLFAAWAKALDPAAFAEQIRLEGLDRFVAAGPLALAVIAIEVGLGLALLLGVRRLWVLVPAAILVAFFLFLTGRAYWMDVRGIAPPEAAACGCFGNLVQRTPAEAFWQDLLLLVPALALAFVGRPRGGRAFPPLRGTAALLAAAGAALFAWRSPALPLDDLATRLKPGVEVGDLCAGAEGERMCLDTVAPELAEGEHLVVLADLEDPAFGAAVERLNAYAGEPARPGLVVVSAAAPEKHTAFYWRWGPAFQIRDAPPALVRPLYRRLPRAFRVRQGKVIETYAGLGPELTRGDER